MMGLAGNGEAAPPTAEQGTCIRGILFSCIDLYLLWGKWGSPSRDSSRVKRKVTKEGNRSLDKIFICIALHAEGTLIGLEEMLQGNAF